MIPTLTSTGKSTRSSGLNRTGTGLKVWFWTSRSHGIGPVSRSRPSDHCASRSLAPTGVLPCSTDCFPTSREWLKRLTGHRRDKSHRVTAATPHGRAYRHVRCDPLLCRVRSALSWGHALPGSSRSGGHTWRLRNVSWRSSKDHGKAGQHHCPAARAGEDGAAPSELGCSFAH